MASVVQACCDMMGVLAGDTRVGIQKDIFSGD